MYKYLLDAAAKSKIQVWFNSDLKFASIIEKLVPEIIKQPKLFQIKIIEDILV